MPHPTIAAIAIPIRRPIDGESPWAIMTISTTAKRIKNAAAVRNKSPPMIENAACVLVWLFEVLIVMSFVLLVALVRNL